MLVSSLSVLLPRVRVGPCLPGVGWHCLTSLPRPCLTSLARLTSLLVAALALRVVLLLEPLVLRTTWTSLLHISK